MVVEFHKDDEYQRWLSAHGAGFVLNTYQEPAADYMVLHRAKCSSIANYTRMAKPGGFTERQYMKACGDTVEELRSWARRHGLTTGVFTRECSRCKPL